MEDPFNSPATGESSDPFSDAYISQPSFNLPEPSADPFSESNAIEPSYDFSAIEQSIQESKQRMAEMATPAPTPEQLRQQQMVTPLGLAVNAAQLGVKLNTSGKNLLTQGWSSGLTYDRISSKSDEAMAAGDYDTVKALSKLQTQYNQLYGKNTDEMSFWDKAAYTAGQSGPLMFRSTVAALGVNAGLALAQKGGESVLRSKLAKAGLTEALAMAGRSFAKREAALLIAGNVGPQAASPFEEAIGTVGNAVWFLVDAIRFIRGVKGAKDITRAAAMAPKIGILGSLAGESYLPAATGLTKAGGTIARFAIESQISGNAKIASGRFVNSLVEDGVDPKYIPAGLARSVGGIESFIEQVATPFDVFTAPIEKQLLKTIIDRSAKMTLEKMAARFGAKKGKELLYKSAISFGKRALVNITKEESEEFSQGLNSDFASQIVQQAAEKDIIGNMMDLLQSPDIEVDGKDMVIDALKQTYDAFPAIALMSLGFGAGGTIMQQPGLHTANTELASKEKAVGISTPEQRASFIEKQGATSEAKYQIALDREIARMDLETQIKKASEEQARQKETEQQMERELKAVSDFEAGRIPYEQLGKAYGLDPRLSPDEVIAAVYGTTKEGNLSAAGKNAQKLNLENARKIAAGAILPKGGVTYGQEEEKGLQEVTGGTENAIPIKSTETTSGVETPGGLQEVGQEVRKEDIPQEAQVTGISNEEETPEERKQRIIARQNEIAQHRETERRNAFTREGWNGLTVKEIDAERDKMREELGRELKQLSHSELLGMLSPSEHDQMMKETDDARGEGPYVSNPYNKPVLQEINDRVQVVNRRTKQNRPVSAAYVDAYGIRLPEGYVREGDLYVFKSEPSTAPAPKGGTEAELTKLLPAPPTRLALNAPPTRLAPPSPVEGERRVIMARDINRPRKPIRLYDFTPVPKMDIRQQKAHAEKPEVRARISAVLEKWESGERVGIRRSDYELALQWHDATTGEKKSAVLQKIRAAGQEGIERLPRESIVKALEQMPAEGIGIRTVGDLWDEMNAAAFGPNWRETGNSLSRKSFEDSVRTWNKERRQSGLQPIGIPRRESGVSQKTWRAQDVSRPENIQIASATARTPEGFIEGGVAAPPTLADTTSARIDDFRQRLGAAFEAGDQQAIASISAEAKKFASTLSEDQRIAALRVITGQESGRVQGGTRKAEVGEVSEGGGLEQLKSAALSEGTQDTSERFQTSAAEKPLSREEHTANIRESTQKAGGRFIAGAPNTPHIGTAKVGNLTIRYEYAETGKEGTSGSVQRTGNVDYIVRISPTTGQRTTVAHETGHIARDVMNPQERKVVGRLIGADLNTLDGDESLARKMQTAEGRADLAKRIVDATPSERSFAMRAINKIVDFINAVFGTNIKKFGSAGEFQRLAEGLKDFSLLSRTSKRGMELGAIMQAKQSASPSAGLGRSARTPAGLGRSALNEATTGLDKWRKQRQDAVSSLKSMGLTEDGIRRVLQRDSIVLGDKRKESLFKAIKEADSHLDPEVIIKEGEAWYRAKEGVKSLAALERIDNALDNVMERYNIAVSAQLQAEQSPDIRYQPAEPSSWQSVQKDNAKRLEVLKFARSPEGMMARQAAMRNGADWKGQMDAVVQAMKPADKAADPEIEASILKAAGKLKQLTIIPETGEQLTPTEAKLRSVLPANSFTKKFSSEVARVRNALSGGMFETLRTLNAMSKMGISQQWEDFSRKWYNIKGKLNAAYEKTWMKERDRHTRVMNSGPVKVRVTLGGDTTSGMGGKSVELSLKPETAMTLAATYMRAEMEIKAGHADLGERIKRSLGNFVVDQSANSNPSFVYHINDESIRQLMSQLTPDMKADMELGQKIFDMAYDTANQIFREETGKDLQKDVFYIHIMRDPSFLRNQAIAEENRIRAEHGDAKAEEAKSLFQMLQKDTTLFALNPMNSSFLKSFEGTQAPLLIGSYYENLHQHVSKVADFAFAQPTKSWLEQNILNNAKVTEALRKSAEGQQAYQYMQNLAQQAGGVIHGERTFADKVMGRYLRTASTVRLFSPWVIAKQPLSVLAAVPEFGNDPRYIRAMLMRDKAFIEKIYNEYAQGLLARSLTSAYDPNLPSYRRGGAEMKFTKNMTLQQRIIYAGQKALSWSDRQATDSIIMMAREWVINNKPGLTGEAFYQAVADKATDVTRKTQVATEGIDRTQLERSINDPFRRMIIYMWGGRAAQLNQMVEAMNGLWTDRSPEGIKKNLSTLFWAGIATSAAMSMVDILRDKYRDAFREPEDEDAQDAAILSLMIAENIAGNVPIVGTEILPSVTAPIYESLGAQRQARIRRFMVGRTGVLSGFASDFQNIASGTRQIATYDQQLREAKTPAERRRVMQRYKITVRRTGMSVIRQFSEWTGIPLNQAINLMPWLTSNEKELTENQK